MGLLDLFSKPDPKLSRLPEGSFTIDPEGRILTSTIPQSFPPAHAQEIGARVLSAFQNARQTGVRVNELILHYGALKITAKELRGGAIVFLAPQTIDTAPPKPPSS